MLRTWLIAPLCVLSLYAVSACGNSETSGGGGSTASSGGAAAGGSSSSSSPGGGGSGGSTSSGGSDGGAPLTGRPYDPIVLVGGQIPGLAKVMAGDVVAFARTASGGW